MKLDIKIDYLEGRPADVPRLWVNPAKFKKITGFKTAFSFEQGLIETINYFKKLSENKILLHEMVLKNWEK